MVLGEVNLATSAAKCNNQENQTEEMSLVK
jgi:hypothetical protein